MLTLVQMISAFYFKQKNTKKIPVSYGSGIARELAEPICAAGYRSVFLACGGTIQRKNMLGELILALQKKGIKTTVYSGIVSDPTVENVEKGLALLKENQCDCVIAAGGGSVLDCTKVIALRATNPHCPVSLMSFYLRPLRKALPLFVIPTTSGTGSEVTYFSVITDEEKQRKRAIVTDRYLPQGIIFDAALLKTVPENPTVYAGLDALTHSVEAYISRFKRFFKEDVLSAPKVCRDIFHYLPVVKEEPENEKARLRMAHAAYHAGINFRRNSVGYVHAIAHRLGETYHIPHGLACGVVLPHVLRSSLPEAKKDLDVLAAESGLASSAEEFIARIETLLDELGVKQGFPEIKQEDYPKMLRRIQPEAKMQGCPKWLKNDEIESILEELREKDG